LALLTGGASSGSRRSRRSPARAAAAWAPWASGSLATRWAVAGVLGGLVALLAHALFEDNLSFVPHGTVYFTGLGLAAAAAPRRSASSARVKPWAVAGILVAVAGLSVSAASYAASREAAAAAAAQNLGRMDLALARIVPRAGCPGTRTPGGHGPAAGRKPQRDGRESSRGRAKLPARDPHQLRAIRDPARAGQALQYRAFGEAGTRAAIGELEAALSQNPYYAEIRNDLGVALLRSGDRAGAVDAFRRASEGRAEFVDPLLNLAALALSRIAPRRGMVDRALARIASTTLRLRAALETAALNCLEHGV
jgi:tetratricopeptide (TPR) repeat protein